MNDQTTNPPAPRKRRGCLFYGCLTSIVLVVLAAILAFATVQVIKKKIYAFTGTEPVQLPKVEMPDAEFKSLQDRVSTFGDAMEQGNPGEPLVLNEREINALIARAPSLKQIANKVYVSLDGDQVKGQVSIPVPDVLWFARGRYFNGEATFNVSLENGQLNVKAQEMKVNGVNLPESFMNGLRQENLAKDVTKDPKQAEVISKIESIQVHDSLVTIKAKATQQ
jgi:hypothetical protein